MKGNIQSQTKLYNHFVEKMFLVCLQYCNNREEAEEVLQEGFVKVFEHLHQFKHQGSLEGWIRKIMVHCALRKYRNKRLLRPIVDINSEEIIDTSHDEILAKLGTKELIKMVQQLPPAYRLVFNLFVFEDLKHREIAELLGITEGTSKSNLSAARYLLQKAVASSLLSSKLNYK